MDKDDNSEYKLRFGHFRVAKATTEYPRRGSPSTVDMMPYGRSQGWAGEHSQALNDIGCHPHERGGMTVCDIVDKDGNILSQGIAVCSFSDNFNYKMGRTIAQGRALADLEKHGTAPWQEV